MLSYHLVLFECEAVRLFPPNQTNTSIRGTDTLICRTSPSAGIQHPSVMTTYFANYANRFASYCISMTASLLRPLKQNESGSERRSLYPWCDYLLYKMQKTEILKLSYLPEFVWNVRVV